MAAAGFGGVELRVVTFRGWSGPRPAGMDAASDSWEYTPPPRGRPGRYWSPAILEAFPRLAGYDLRQKMHALLGYGPEVERVIHDLENVERQLVRDNFFKTVAEFLHARGLRHRPQIYGRGLSRDLVEAYLYADTPEVEQGDYCVPEAVWAARTTGKPIVSCEAFTHLHLKLAPVRRPHGEWESSPAICAARPTGCTAGASIASNTTVSATARPACPCPAGACMPRFT